MANIVAPTAVTKDDASWSLATSQANCMWRSEQALEALGNLPLEVAALVLAKCPPMIRLAVGTSSPQLRLALRSPAAWPETVVTNLEASAVLSFLLAAGVRPSGTITIEVISESVSPGVLGNWRGEFPLVVQGAQYVDNWRGAFTPVEQGGRPVDDHMISMALARLFSGPPPERCSLTIYDVDEWISRATPNLKVVGAKFDGGVRAAASVLKADPYVVGCSFPGLRIVLWFDQCRVSERKLFRFCERLKSAPHIGRNGVFLY